MCGFPVPKKQKKQPPPKKKNNNNNNAIFPLIAGDGVSSFAFTGSVILALFPGLSRLQFFSACNMQKQRKDTASDQKLEAGEA